MARHNALVANLEQSGRQPAPDGQHEHIQWRKPALGHRRFGRSRQGGRPTRGNRCAHARVTPVAKEEFNVIVDVAISVVILSHRLVWVHGRSSQGSSRPCGRVREADQGFGGRVPLAQAVSGVRTQALIAVASARGPCDLDAVDDPRRSQSEVKALIAR